MSKNRWEKLRTEFETTAISLADLARKYDIPYSTVYGQKKRNHWKKPKSIKMRGNKRAKGNPGNKKASAPKGNKNRVTHGLFAKWLPKESLDIINDIGDARPEDLIYQNILIQYTAIIRSQKIMNVEVNEVIKEVKKKADTLESDIVEYEISFAWDRQEKFLVAQSRAMGTLLNLIKQFKEMVNEDDERALELDNMRAKVKMARAKADVAKHEADKLSQSGQVNDLLQSLYDVSSEQFEGLSDDDD